MTMQGSPETGRFAHDIQDTAGQLGIPLDRSVVVCSGAIRLAADAAGVDYPMPRDHDYAVAPEVLPGILRRVPRPVQTVPAEHGYDFYRIRLDDGRQVDVADQWGKVPYTALRAGAQMTDEVASASLTVVASHKWAAGRPNDLADVTFIDNLLQRYNDPTYGWACSLEAMLGHTNASEQAAQVLPGSGTAILSDAEIAAITRHGFEGLRRMGVRYGSGVPAFYFREPHEGEANHRILWYNTERHEIEVAADAKRLARRLGLGSLAAHGTVLGAKWHDVRQDCVMKDPSNRQGFDELHSAHELIDVIREAQDVSHPTALWAAYFIMGGQVTLVGNQPASQAGALLPKDAFPCREAWLATAMGGDSDMGHLYEDYRPGICLFAQRLGLRYPQMPNMADDATRGKFREFLENQLKFLDSYRYSLPEAEELFGQKRQTITDHVRQLIARDEAHQTPSDWRDIIAAEDKFAYKHLGAAYSGALLPAFSLS